MPVANEEDTIRELINDILSQGTKDLFVFIIMDKYSKDNSEMIIRSIQENNEHLRLYFYDQSNGPASCYLYGFKKALEENADFIIEMDGGGSHDFKEIPVFVRYLKEGYDCVFGSRFIRGGGITDHPIRRKVLSYAGTLLSNIILGTKLSDMTSGFEAFKKDVLKNMNFDKFLSKGHIYQTEMRFYCRQHKIKEIPITYKGSRSTMKFKAIVEALKVLKNLKKNELLVKGL
jgi:dolichol-phosphate mannosyltransferase